MNKLLFPKLIRVDVLKDLLAPFLVVKPESPEHHTPGDRPEAVRDLLRDWQRLDILVLDPDGHVVPEERDPMENRLPKGAEVDRRPIEDEGQINETISFLNRVLIEWTDIIIREQVKALVVGAKGFPASLADHVDDLVLELGWELPWHVQLVVGVEGADLLHVCGGVGFALGVHLCGDPCPLHFLHRVPFLPFLLDEAPDH